MGIWRPMQHDDIAVVPAIAARVHPELFEDEKVFAERLALAPEGCWLYEGSQDTLGYVLSHPWTLVAPPALNAMLGGIPDVPDTFYIHDLALLPAARGIGAAQDIVETLIRVASGYPAMSLVAVNGSVPFWSRFGFTPVERADLAVKLASYDTSAEFMVRRRTSLA